MPARRVVALVLAWAALVASALPGVPSVIRAQEYTLASRAHYDVRPDEGRIGVTVELTLTNTTPDPDGQFSVFSEIKVAIHDAASEVAASDDEGALEVTASVENEVNVATIELREELRFEEEATVELSYTLPDSDDPQLRVRSSLVVFPAWGFGTSGDVTVTIPAGYEVRFDGDPLTREAGLLTSGPIADPSAWLSLVTAVRPTAYTQLEANVPLDGGTAALVVRSFTDDAVWGERTLDMVARALPLLEEAIGIPYPRTSQLILTEAVATDASGFGESAPSGSEILVAYDQPPFTALHQVAHAWLSDTLVEARWIREGLASHVAAAVADQIGVDRPYDPFAEVEARAGAAFKLDAWSASDGAEADAYGYAASWALVADIATAAGGDTVRAVLRRAAASIGPYEVDVVDPEPPSDGSPPSAPLTTRSFLDHLESISDAELASLFADRVLLDEDVALLDPRAQARAALGALVADAESWGVPDPVRTEMREWRFTEAQERIEAARDWLVERDELLPAMEAVGLAAPERLRQAYTAYGGGPEAAAELDAEREVVDQYRAAVEEVSGERSFMARVGLVGGPDPDAQLTLASGRFGDGDLRGALEAITEARRIIGAAETGGLVRVASLVALALVLVVAAIILFRRRATYTAAA